MIKLRSLLVENVEDLINDIKLYLYSYGDYSSWNEFVDHQELGECQSIVSGIIWKFPLARKVFSSIEGDKSYVDEDGKEQILQTHHWITINNIPLDFSKGTLRDYIDFENLYDVHLGNDAWRYKMKRR